jgi:hypothetical protein
LDLQQFYEDIESSAEQGGRPAFDPQLLLVGVRLQRRDRIGAGSGAAVRV